MFMEISANDHDLDSKMQTFAKHVSAEVSTEVREDIAWSNVIV